MWTIEIRLFYCYICGTFSNCQPERSQGFLSTRKWKKNNNTQNMAEQTNDRKEKKRSRTQHAFIVLCIYAIVYVWIWRIWKYMLTNLYRVFYVMWNTWSRCSPLSLSLSLSFFHSLFFLHIGNISDDSFCSDIFETLDPIRVDNSSSSVVIFALFNLYIFIYVCVDIYIFIYMLLILFSFRASFFLFVKDESSLFPLALS